MGTGGQNHYPPVLFVCMCVCVCDQLACTQSTFAGQLSVHGVRGIVGLFHFSQDIAVNGEWLNE